MLAARIEFVFDVTCPRLRDRAARVGAVAGELGALWGARVRSPVLTREAPGFPL